ncbi:MAG: hypothetical protein ACI9OJ_004779 [Myxococcota bacterium]|jgi:hypothetical protein
MQTGVGVPLQLMQLGPHADPRLQGTHEPFWQVVPGPQLDAVQVHWPPSQLGVSPLQGWQSAPHVLSEVHAWQIPAWHC